MSALINPMNGLVALPSNRVAGGQPEKHFCPAVPGRNSSSAIDPETRGGGARNQLIEFTQPH